MWSRLLKLKDRLLIREMQSYLERLELKEQGSDRMYVYERPIEYGFVLSELNRHHMMHILDVGSGASAFPALLRQCGFIVTASDSKGSYWSEYSNRHIWVHQDDIASTSLEHGSFDAVVAVSCIEHIEDAAAAVRNMSALARVGGLVVLTFPYSQDEYLDNVYALPAADAMSRSFRYFAHSFSDAQIDEWKLEGALSEVSRTYVRGWTGKYWRTGERLPFAEKVEDPSVANCLCISLKKTD